MNSGAAVGGDGTIYVASRDGNLYALDGGTGAKNWAFTTQFPIDSSPAIGADGTVYIGANDGNVYAIGP